MQQLEMMILPGFFIATVIISIVIGYWMGRRTVTDVPLITTSFNPKDGKDPEMDEITRCLQVPE